MANLRGFQSVGGKPLHNSNQILNYQHLLGSISLIFQQFIPGISL